MQPIPALTRTAWPLGLRSDADLVERVRGGHDDAFAELVRRYHAALLRYCARLVGEDRAEDAVQVALVQALVALRRPDARALEARPWLYRIAHNASIDVLRRAPPPWEQIDPQHDGVPQPPQVFERRERLRETLRAIAALPERQRRALVLRELEDRDYEEIAAALGVGQGSVRQLLFRARATLRSAAGLLLVPPWALRRLLGHMAARLGSFATATASSGAGVAAKVGVVVLATGTLAVGAATLPPGPAGHQVAAAQPLALTPALVVSGPVAPAVSPRFGGQGSGRSRSHLHTASPRARAPYIGGGRRTASGPVRRTARPVKRLNRSGTPGRHSTPPATHESTPAPVPVAITVPTPSHASAPPSGSTSDAPASATPSPGPAPPASSPPAPPAPPPSSGHIVSYQPGTAGAAGSLTLVRAANNETVTALVTDATAVTCHYYSAGVAGAVATCSPDNLRSGVPTTGFPTQRPINGQGTWTQVDLIIDQ